MIPVQQQSEPSDFEDKVRKKGLAFLQEVPNPKTKDWQKGAYWLESLTDLYNCYNKICAYLAEWIPDGTGSRTVDHFIPKSKKPELAYEWSNFRLACSKMNTRKSTHLDIIDPFTLAPDSFILEFPSMLIKANSTLLEPIKGKVINTIERLKLNEKMLPEGRAEKLIDYCRQDCTFESLKRRYPFIAYELERQGLKEVDKIALIMNVERLTPSN